MKLKLTAIAALTSAMLTACGSTPETKLTTLPDWVAAPVIEDGIAASECVKASSKMSIDKKMVTAARTTIAQQLNSKVDAMAKTYSRRTETNEDTYVSGTFEDVSKQLTKQSLTGSQLVRFEQVMINNQPHWCGMVTMSPATTKALFDDLVEAADVPLNAKDEALMYEEFRAHKAQEDLAQEISAL